MKKTIGVVVLLMVIAAGAGIFLTRNNQESSSQQIMTVPTRPAEITGAIVSVEGNEVIVAKEIGRVVLSEAEQAAKKAEMQKLSEEQRKAAREAESTQYPTENVTLVIPVGIPIVQGTGDGSGNTKLADITSLNKGTYVSIWNNSEGNVEYVKIKGL